MTAINLLGIAIAVVLAGLVLLRIIPAAQTYFLYRGKWLVNCPETLNASGGCCGEKGGCECVPWRAYSSSGAMLALARAPGLWSGVPQADGS